MSKEYTPTEAQEALAIERYKKHQRKMKWIPLYRYFHKKQTQKEIRAVHDHYYKNGLTKAQVYQAIANLSVPSLPSDSPEMKYWQGYSDAQYHITKRIEKL